MMTSSNGNIFPVRLLPFVRGIHRSLHYSDVIMSAMASQFTCVSVVFSTFCADVEENIKAPRHLPLWGEFTGDQWIPRTKGQKRGKCFHLMTSSWPVDFPHKGQWREALMFSLICAWTNGWANNRYAGDLSHRAHYNVIVMLRQSGTWVTSKFLQGYGQCLLPVSLDT